MTVGRSALERLGRDVASAPVVVEQLRRAPAPRWHRRPRPSTADRAARSLASAPGREPAISPPREGGPSRSQRLWTTCAPRRSTRRARPRSASAVATTRISGASREQRAQRARSRATGTGAAGRADRLTGSIGSSSSAAIGDAARADRRCARALERRERAKKRAALDAPRSTRLDRARRRAGPSRAERFDRRRPPTLSSAWPSCATSCGRSPRRRVAPAQDRRAIGGDCRIGVRDEQRDRRGVHQAEPTEPTSASTAAIARSGRAPSDQPAHRARAPASSPSADSAATAARRTVQLASHRGCEQLDHALAAEHRRADRSARSAAARRA